MPGKRKSSKYVDIEAPNDDTKLGEDEREEDEVRRIEQEELVKHKDFIASENEVEEEEDEEEEEEQQGQQGDEEVEEAASEEKSSETQEARDFTRSFTQSQFSQSATELKFFGCFVDNQSRELWTTIRDPELIAIKDELVEMCTNAIQPPDIEAQLMNFYQLSDEDMNFRHLFDIVKPKFHLGIINMHILFSERRLLRNAEMGSYELKEQFKQLHAFVQLTIEILIAKVKVKDYLAGRFEEANVYQVESADLSEVSAAHRCVLYLFTTLKNSQLRRYKDECFHEVSVRYCETTDGDRFFEEVDIKDEEKKSKDVKVLDIFNTHSWKKFKTIQEYIYSEVSKTKNFNRWKELPISGYDCVATYLKLCDDHDFAEIVPQREVRSFYNGYLDLSFRDEKWVSFFDKKQIKPDLICCKHYNSTFDSTILHQSHWYHIPTPHFDRIFDDQKLTEATKRILYVLFGRLLYALNTHDNFGVILFVIGRAGTGKSTLGKVAKAFFQSVDVAVLSSNIEELFGLSAIRDKLLMICNEVTKQWKLNRGDTQCIIVGDDVNLAEKNKSAKTETWKVPGLFFGNEFGPWLDSNQSMGRRLLCTSFENEVKVDENLEQKLLQECPNIIFKCQQAYKEFVAKDENRSFWEKVPKYFTYKKEKFALEMNPVKEFLVQGEKVDFKAGDETFIMSYMIFNNMIRDFLKGTRNDKMSSLQIQDALKILGVTIKETAHNGFHGLHLFGVRIRNHDEPLAFIHNDAHLAIDAGRDDQEFLESLPHPHLEPIAAATSSSVVSLLAH